MKRETIPYTYLIGWSTQNKWYYGVRFAKFCHPNDLWNPYKTSSKTVKEFEEEWGPPDVLQVRKTFKNASEARMWEHRVLKRMKVTSRDDFLNRTDNISFAPVSRPGEQNNFYGRKHTDRTKSLISAKHKGRIIPEYTRQRSSETHKGVPKTKEHREKISKGLKGKPKSDYVKSVASKTHKGKVISEEHKAAIRAAHKGRVVSEETRAKLRLAAQNRVRRKKEQNE